MLLVLFFIILFFIALVIMAGSIKVKILNLKISSEQIKNVQFDVRILFYLFNKLKLLDMQIDRKKIDTPKMHKIIEKASHSKTVMKIKKMNLKELNKNINLKNIIKYLKKLRLKVEKLKLKIELDTKNVLLITYLVPIISTIIAILLSKFANKCKRENYFYVINPLYENRNFIKIETSCIISLKLVHIINIIYIFLRKGRKRKDERTSNRRVNDNCYE